jgi:hypothetical protein
MILLEYLFIPCHVLFFFLIFLNLIKFKLITFSLPLFHPLQCPSRIFTPLNLMKLKKPYIHALHMLLNFVQKNGHFTTPLNNTEINHFDVCLLEGYLKCWTASRHDPEMMTGEHLLCVLNCMKHLTHDVGSCFEKCYERHL